MSIDWFSLVIGLGLGGSWGYALRLWQTLPARPLRLLPLTTFNFSPPVSVQTNVDPWRLWTRAYIGLCEHLTRHASDPRRLPGRERLQEATGASWRTWMPYNTVLQSGGLVVNLGAAGRYWVVGRRERRLALAGLPYPASHAPPMFKWSKE